VDRLWHAAALGLGTRLEQLLEATPGPTADDITEAFWQACHGGQRRTAQFLLGLGPDINAIASSSEMTALDMAGSTGTGRDTLVTWLRPIGATSAVD
jgi:ankyrin repeat protein